MRYRFLVPFLLLTSVLAAEQVLSVGTTVLTQADLAALEGPTLVFLPLEVPLTVRVNGALASQRGNLDQPYTGRLHWATALSLQPWASPALGDLRVEIQLQPAEGEPSVLGPVRLLSRTEALDWVFWRNFWGPQAITALSWASLVVGLSSFLLFLVGHRLPRRDRVLYLVYFLTNLTFAVSYINNVFSWDLAPTLELDKLSRAGMYWWLYFATAANVLYLQPPARPGRVLVPAAAVIAVVTVLLALAPSVPAVSTLQRLVGIPLLSVLLLYLLVRSVLLLVRHRDWQAGLLVVVYLLGAWAMVADSVPYFVLKYKPTVMLAPFTAFLSDLAFLWLLAFQYNQRHVETQVRAEELQNLKLSLENRVEERTRELSEANQNLQFFFSVMAHDLRNQVHGLSGLGRETAELARQQPFPARPEVTALVDLMHESARLTGQQLESLLAWSQVRLGLLHPHTSPVVAQELLTQVASEFRVQATAGEVRLAVESDPETVVLCDPEMTRTLLRNLVANAVRFAPPGSEVVLSAKLDSTNVRLSVSDQGPGWTIPSGDSSGFGLRVVRALAEAQGFQLELAPQPGAGTTCLVLVPRRR